jgi:hypothetical protein
MKCLLLFSGDLDVEEMRDRVIAAEEIKIAKQRKGREKPRKREKPQILDSESDDPKEKAKKKVLKSYKIPKNGEAASLITSEQVNSKIVSKKVEHDKDENHEDLEQDSDDQVDLHHNETFSDEEETKNEAEKSKKTQDESATPVLGGFQLEFVDISQVTNHMTCYNSKALIGGYFPLQDLPSSLNAVISTNESNQIYNRSCDL